MTIFPFISILIAYSAYLIYDYIQKIHVHLPSAECKLINYAFLLIIFGLGVYNIFINLKYVEAYDHPAKNTNWSAEINNLISYTKERDEKFVILDWGIHNQLITFTKTKDKYYEVFWYLFNRANMSPLNEADNVKSKEWLYEHFIKDTDNRFILHGSETTNFPDPRKNFFDTVSEHNMKAVKIKEFNEADRVIFEIYGIMQ